MRLYDNAFSPYAFKLRVALYEKGIPFEQHELRHHRDRDELLRRNPRGEVPALEDGATVLHDSTVICEYLEDTHPSPPLLPAEPAARARCRALELVADTQLDACVFILGALVLRREVRERVPEALGHCTAALAAHHASLERELRGDYFTDALSLADIAVYPHLRSAAFLGYPVTEQHTRLDAWMQRMSARPSIRQAVREMARAFEQFRTDPDPFFSRERTHWRNDRLECAVRCGLGPWVLEELAAGRAFFSPLP